MSEHGLPPLPEPTEGGHEIEPAPTGDLEAARELPTRTETEPDVSRSPLPRAPQLDPEPWVAGPPPGASADSHQDGQWVEPGGGRRAERREERTRYGAAVVGAALAALAMGALWGVAVHLRDADLRPAPILVGLLVGIATRLSGGGKGRDTGGLHAIAAFFTLAGIVLGKYLTFEHLYAVGVPTEPTVQPSPFDHGIFSMETFRLFIDNPGVSFQAIDGLWIMVAVAAAMLGLVPSEETEARPRPESHNPVDKVTGGLPEPLRVAADWIVTIVGAVAIVLLVKQFAINPYRIPSSSMEPTLHCAQPESGCEARFSDRVLANRFVYHLHGPRRGDIVVFNVPSRALQECGADGVFVKRLIGLPGETIQVKTIKGDGYVFINGKRLNEPYLKGDRRGPPNNAYGPKKIPPGHYFMMGDNRSSSCDSRAWGTVPRGNIIGKVFATYWPPGRVSLH